MTIVMRLIVSRRLALSYVYNLGGRGCGGEGERTGGRLSLRRPPEIITAIDAFSSRAISTNHDIMVGVLFLKVKDIGCYIRKRGYFIILVPCH